MTQSIVDTIARALLYEGYVLYPYRPSVKSQQRWTFGGVYPRAWSEAQEGTDPCMMQTQCLLERGPAAALRIRVRFLHLVDRTIGELVTPAAELPQDREPEFRDVRSLDVGEKSYHAWQEAVEREVDLGEIDVAALLAGPREMAFALASQRTIEPLRAPGAPIVAILIRRQVALNGCITLSATALEGNVVRVTVRIANSTPMPGEAGHSRDDALLRTLISTHTILETKNAAFISLTDPPERCRAHAALCVNTGTWPVLVGTPGDRGTMLSSPIIVEDYPKIAPQSPGDLFDGTEIDEILTLRIMTLTDEEKRLAAGVDDRVRDLLERTQSLARDQLMGLHGTLRPVEPWHGHPAHDSGALNTGMMPVPQCDTGMMPVPQCDTGRMPVPHLGLKVGDAVRLRPLGRADVMDIALDGKAATIVSIEQDFENRVYVAVTVDDDPGKDLGLRGQPGHRFFFGVEEVEPLARAEVAT